MQATATMTLTQFIIALILAIIASSGIWGIVLYKIQRRDNKKDNFTKLLLGLAHQEIVRSCLNYMNRGYITKDEYEDLIKYLFEPYKDLGGNGTVEKLIDEIKKLPLKEMLI